jgi:hypothetical protein
VNEIDVLARLPYARRVQLVVTVEAQSIGDTEVAPAMAAALLEFVREAEKAQPGSPLCAPSGKFESADGVDVSWRTMTRFYRYGALIGQVGITGSGKRIHTMKE